MKNRVWHMLFISYCTILITGCDRSQPPTETTASSDNNISAVAKVNGEAVTIEELQAYLDSRSSFSGGSDDERVIWDRLQELVSMQALALEAIRRKLDKDPAVKYAVHQLLVQKLLEQEVLKPVGDKQVSSAEVEAYYTAHIDEYVRPRQVRLADIFISVPVNSSPEVWQEKRQEAERLLAKALQVEQKRFGFATLIQEHSDKHPLYPKGDTSYFDEQGGGLGLDPVLVKAAFELTDKGKVHSQVIETGDGFHVVMLVSSRAAIQRDIKDLANEIEQRIKRQEVQQKRDLFIQSIVDTASVEIFDDRVQELASSLNTAQKTGRNRSGQQYKKGATKSSTPPFMNSKE